jgi:hypothetical protein
VAKKFPCHILVFIRRPSGLLQDCMCEWQSTTKGCHHSAVPGNVELPTETNQSVRNKSCLRPVVTALCVLQTYFWRDIRSLVPTKTSLVISKLCIECSAACDSVARCTALNTHTTAWNTCCHNTAALITMYFYWLILQKLTLARLSLSSLRMVQMDRNM